MLPQVRTRLQASIDYHQKVVDHFAAQIKKPAESAEPESAPTADERENLNEGEQRGAQAVAEADQAPPKSFEEQQVDLHSGVVRQLTDLLQSEPDGVAITHARQERVAVREQHPGLVRRLLQR